MSSGDYQFTDYGNAYASPTISSFPDSIGNLQPIQPTGYPGVPPQSRQAQHPSQQHNGFHARGEKRKSETLSPSRQMSFEDQTRVAAEEDKRRRNTAASARFRVKKKMREQALEKSAKEMTDKVTKLETRVQQLETENKWLKNLVVEKSGGSEDRLARLIEDYKAQEKAREKEEAEAIPVPPTSPEESDARDSSG
jgi:hypothetical protein